MTLLVVPMNPEFLPEGMLLIGGAFALGAAIHALFAKQTRRALKVGGAGLACIAVAIALGKFTHKPKQWPEGRLVPAAQDSTGRP